MWVWSLEDPLEEEVVPHSKILAGRMPRTEEPDRVQFMVSQTVRHKWVSEQYQDAYHTVGNLFGSFLSFLCHEKAFLAFHSPICLFLHLFPLLEETYTKNIAKTDVKEHAFVF